MLEDENEISLAIRYRRRKLPFEVAADASSRHQKPAPSCHGFAGQVEPILPYSGRLSWTEYPAKAAIPTVEQQAEI